MGPGRGRAQGGLFGMSGFEFITRYYVQSIFSVHSRLGWARIIHRGSPGICQASRKLGRQLGQVYGRKASGTRRVHPQLLSTEALSKLMHRFEDLYWSLSMRYLWAFCY